MNNSKIYKIPDNVVKDMIRREVIFTSLDIVKELIDNAIDAGSTNIEIYINNNNITVKDNGCGMNMKDLLMCKNSYTTSKYIKNIDTLGFRGMALYNINQICKLCIQTRTCNDDICIYLNEYNQIKYVHGDVGTIVYSHNINIHIETNRKIIALIKQYIVLYDHIKFKLYIKDKLYTYTKDRILFENHKGIYQFSGEKFHGVLIKNNKQMFYMYFNQHCVFSKNIHDSIMKAWKQITSGKDNISYCIYLNLSHEDICLSAAKNHVEILNTDIYEQINESVLNTLKSGKKDSHSFTNKNSMFSNMQFLNTLQNRYILCEDEKHDLILIDAHAAHERIVAEQLRNNQYYMQALLSEIILSIDNINIYKKNLDRICKFYIQDNCLFITHVINILYYLNEELLFMFERIIHEPHVTANTILLDFFHDYGCKNAIRHHHYLSENDCKNIIQQLFKCDHYEFCNHGRRTYYRITINEINRIFEK